MESSILRFFEQIRNGFLDYFFGFFTLIGEEFFVAGIILIIYLLWNKQLGERVIFTVLSATVLTTALKGIGRARPYHNGVVSAGNITIDDLGANSSFPSGHATCSSALGTSIGIVYRKKWYIPTMIAITILLICLSRLYFGVHYPTDILAGLAIGIVLSFFWAFIEAKFPNYKIFIFTIFALASIPCLFIPALQVNDNIFQMSALMLAFSNYLFFERYFLPLQNCKTWLHRLYRLFILGTIALLLFLPLYFLPKSNFISFLQIFIVTLGTLIGSTTLFKICKI